MVNPEVDMGGYEPRLIPIEDYEVQDLDLYLQAMREGYASIPEPLPHLAPEQTQHTDLPTGKTQLDFDDLNQTFGDA